MSIPFLVKDIYPGSSNSSPGSLTARGNTLFFTANDGVNGGELWKSDGTAAGTVLVKDIRSGSSNSSPSYQGERISNAIDN
jgi:ELWxxDGT repeat protein